MLRDASTVGVSMAVTGILEAEDATAVSVTLDRDLQVCGSSRGTPWGAPTAVPDRVRKDYRWAASSCLPEALQAGGKCPP